MSKYHIRKDGTPGICKAISSCPLGKSNEHFNTIESSQYYADLKNELLEISKNEPGNANKLMQVSEKINECFKDELKYELYNLNYANIDLDKRKYFDDILKTSICEEFDVEQKYNIIKEFEDNLDENNVIYVVSNEQSIEDVVDNMPTKMLQSIISYVKPEVNKITNDTKWEVEEYILKESITVNLDGHELQIFKAV